MPTIVVFNGLFEDTRLPDNPGATFTRDRARLPEADAVIFHLPSLDLPWIAPKYPGQLWVAWSMESAVNYPIVGVPAILAAFDIRMTYRRSAEVWLTYAPPDLPVRALLPPPPKTAPAPVAMFQSSRLDRSGRDAYVRRLMERIEVHSFGRHMRNRALPERDRGRETKLSVIGRYKFCLGFENAIEADYVTEKFYDPFLAGSVCVYRGAPNVADFAPAPHSFINADDFAGPEALAEHLIALDADDAAYGEHFRWKPRGLDPGYVRRVVEPHDTAWDRLVETVKRMRMSRPAAPAGGAPTYPLAWLRPRGLGAHVPNELPPA